MTVEEFTIHVGALVIRAQAAGLSVAQEISVLNGVLDELKREVVVRKAAGGERRGND